VGGWSPNVGRSPLDQYEVISLKVLHSLLLSRVGVALITLSCCVGEQSFVNSSSTQRPAAQAKVASIPIEVGENYVFIKASVNGSAPLTFILDSGAGSGLILYSKAAQALGLKLQGKGKGGGAGEGTFDTTSVKGVSLSFPGVEMSNQTFVVFPPSKTSAFDRVVDGVIGYTLFSRYVVELDYQSRNVNLYEPKTYQYSGSGESIPLRILSNVPFVRMKIPIEGRKPLEGDFIVDLGAGRFTSILNTPLVESNSLLAVAQKTIKEPGAEGVGGEVKLLVGRLPHLQLGSFTLTDPVVHFAQDRKGAFASSEFSGVIGGELLRRFKVIFDYAHKRMILEPNADLAERFEYDMSGIRLRAEGEDFKTLRVQRVMENSPASEAGVREGDLISAIDGKPTAELSLSQIKHMFKQQDQEYLLGVIRGEEKKQIKLKLRRLV
jgi:Aspartyl protease/PDZ domain